MYKIPKQIGLELVAVNPIKYVSYVNMLTEWAKRTSLCVSKLLYEVIQKGSVAYMIILGVIYSFFLFEFNSWNQILFLKVSSFFSEYNFFWRGVSRI
jgi:hypothetical protein